MQSTCCILSRSRVVLNNYGGDHRSGHVNKFASPCSTKMLNKMERAFYSNLQRTGGSRSPRTANLGPKAQSSGGDNELELQRQQLSRSLDTVPMSGSELRELVFNKWNRSYEVRLQRRGKRMYLHVMWKFLEQKSFMMSEEEYDLQCEAVADYINLWGVADIVRQGINSAKYAPGYMTGGNAKAYSIPLGVEISAGRSNEWNSF